MLSLMKKENFSGTLDKLTSGLEVIDIVLFIA